MVRVGAVDAACGLARIPAIHRVNESKERLQEGFVLRKAKRAEPILLQVLAGKKTKRPPVWLMRQAGRYLPEYRLLRAKARDFLSFCYTPELAVEATLQPVRRFGFDAAILFSDILVIPDALGRMVRFVEGDGPQLDPISEDEIARLEPVAMAEKISPVLAAVEELRARLAVETALIGFCGAPWTVATYMIAGRSSADQAEARLFAYRHPRAMQRLLDVLGEVSTDYLVGQLDAGADCVQIFDSWAGVLPQDEFRKWCVDPVAKMIAAIRNRRPHARIIAFPRGAGTNYRGFAKATGANAIGLDWTVSDAFGRNLQKTAAVQGNLDPLVLNAGGDALNRAVDRILEVYGGGPHVFNLGHGILPDTPIGHVEQMLKRMGR
jgi:uroporphyrinogen decarboxylase